MFISYQGGESSQAISGQFILEDRHTDGEALQVSYPVVLPKQSGMFSIALQYPLEVEQWYRWYFVVDCLGTETVTQEIEGYIYRQVSLGSAPEFSPDSPQTLVNWYIEQGIWYEAFDQAVQLDCHGSSHSARSQLWKTLLSSDDIQLTDLTVAPLNCITANTELTL